MWEFRKSCFGKKIIFMLLIASTSSLTFSSSKSLVDQLEGKADFKMASLQWKYGATNEKINPPLSFRVKYCELHAWGMHRCRYQIADTNRSKNGRRDKRLSVSRSSNDTFLFKINGLRMATNYSFQVLPLALGQKFSQGGKGAIIKLQTKGFSAKAKECLADSSVVSVETGPYFGGRISVEDSISPNCFVQGDPKSPQTSYDLKIVHKECGSTVNGSSVKTVLLVQENIPILTHSTRKFIVLCSFSPDSFIVKTGVTLPRESSIGKGIDFSTLIRLSPNGPNLLIGDKDKRVMSSGRTKSSQKSNQELLQSFPSEEHGKKNSTQSEPLISRRQSRAYFHDLDSDSRSNSEPQGLISQNLNENRAQNDEKFNFNGLLVLGLVSIAIVASVSSLLWLTKSYSSSSNAKNEEERSEISSSSSFSLETSSLDDFERRNLDTRSELEVELDFEFSEERNREIFSLNANGRNSRNANNNTNANEDLLSYCKQTLV